MKILFGTVIYEGVKEYLEEFLLSINDQTYNKFDLYIINDGFKDEKLLNSQLNLLSIPYVIKKDTERNNPSQLRKKIIDYALEENYDLLIFGDSDDTFSINRVDELVRSVSNEYGFYYNKIFVMNSNNDFFDGRLPEKIDKFNALDDMNFIGMSNSAINLNTTSNILRKLGELKNCIAFDWYLYTLLVKHNIHGRLVENAITYYRIYHNNIAGDTNKLTLEKLTTGIKVKQFQYSALKDYDSDFEVKLAEINRLGQYLQDDILREKYILEVNSKFKDSVFWWENIKVIKEEVNRDENEV